MKRNMDRMGCNLEGNEVDEPLVAAGKQVMVVE